MVSSDIRKEARASLKGKWGKGALITLVYMLIVYAMQLVANLIPLVGAIALLVIEVPIAYGIVVSFMKLKRGEEVSVVGFLTDGFAEFKKSWSVTWNTIKKLIIPLILVIVFAVMMGAGVTMKAQEAIGDAMTALNAYESLYNSEMEELDSLYGTSSKSIRTSSLAREQEIKEEQKSGIASTLLSIVGGIGYLVAVIYMAVKSLYYSLSMYILKDNNGLTGKEIVEKSEELMKGNRWSYFWLSLTFIGWAILATFTFGIGMFWLLPYMQIAQIVFYEDRAGMLKESEVEAIQ